MSKASNLTAARLREALDYEPDTGIFRWKRSGHGVYPGKPAGAPNGDGYICIQVDGVLQEGHRLAWLYTHGVWPTHQIDHINEDTGDNRLENLRDYTPGQNRQNITKLSRANKSGFRGVSRFRKRWQAGIMVNGKQFNLGQFDTPEEASAAYQAAKLRLHPFATPPVDKSDDEV